MARTSTDIHQRIAAQTRELRAARGLSLDALATKSGVSRSMISLIERGEASPTAVVLERLAWGLGVPLAQLFDAREPDTAAPSPLARRAEQAQWRDPGSGYVRRNLSAPHWPSPLHLVEVEFPAGARVAYESDAREPAVHQQVWVLEGAIEITIGHDHYTLSAGDCISMQLDRPIAYANRSRKTARYLVAIDSGHTSPRTTS